MWGGCSWCLTSQGKFLGSRDEGRGSLPASQSHPVYCHTCLILKNHATSVQVTEHNNKYTLTCKPKHSQYCCTSLSSFPARAAGTFVWVSKALRRMELSLLGMVSHHVFVNLNNGMKRELSVVRSELRMVSPTTMYLPPDLKHKTLLVWSVP